MFNFQVLNLLCSEFLLLKIGLKISLNNAEAFLSIISGKNWLGLHPLASGSKLTVKNAFLIAILKVKPSLNFWQIWVKNSPPCFTICLIYENLTTMKLFTDKRKIISLNENTNSEIKVIILRFFKHLRELCPKIGYWFHQC